MIYGMDFLAGAQYRHEVRANLPAGWALGGFATTFGDFYPVAEEACGRHGPLLRVHLTWSDTHSYGDKDMPVVKKLAAKYNKLAKKYPNTSIVLSPFCEHNIKQPLKYMEIAQNSAPDCRIVNTPWKGGYTPAYMNECHGEKEKPQNGQYIFSFDGTEAVDSNVEEFKSKYGNAQVFFLWTARYNLKWSMKDTTPRPERKAFPNKEMIKSIEYLTSTKGETEVPKGWLVKSHAERHNAADTKGDKLLIIAPIKVDAIRLKTKVGKIVDSLMYYGPFDGGGHRYYSSKMGYQIAYAAIAASGSPILEITAGHKRFGKCNAGFRDPYWR